jgi:hypothetical protein
MFLLLSRLISRALTARETANMPVAPASRRPPYPPGFVEPPSTVARLLEYVANLNAGNPSPRYHRCRTAFFSARGLLGL